MHLNVENGALLLLVAGIVAMLTRRLRLPYSVGLVATGIVLAFLPFAPTVGLTKELLFTTLLPPLIFEAAFYLQWTEVRRDLPVLLLLATVGVLISAGITALGMNLLAGWNVSTALVFGTLIAATDPVSVIATFREAGVHGRLRLLVEAESLFNDGTAAVALQIAVLFALGSRLDIKETAVAVLLTIGGGIVCGAMVAGLAILLTRRADDHLVEITFTTVAAYGSFLVAEHFHVSGILSTLTAGLMLGNFGPRGVISPRGMEAAHTFWEYAAFVANSLVFLLIGIHEAGQDIRRVWIPSLAGIVLVMIGRAVAVYADCYVFKPFALRVTIKHQHALVWGGLRGALALALALGLPAELQGRAEIIAVSFSVVTFSVFVQGLTMQRLLRKIGEIPDAAIGRGPSER